MNRNLENYVYFTERFFFPDWNRRKRVSVYIHISKNGKTGDMYSLTEGRENKRKRKKRKEGKKQ